MKKKKLLAKVTVELVEGKELLKKEKKELKKTRDPLRKENKKRAVNLLKMAVLSLEEHRELLKAPPQKHVSKK